MNVLRKAMPEHVEALRGPLFAAYRSIVTFQFERTDEAEAAMRRAIGEAVPLLRPFRKLLPRFKQNYLRALVKLRKTARSYPRPTCCCCSMRPCFSCTSA